MNNPDYKKVPLGLKIITAIDLLIALSFLRLLIISLFSLFCKKTFLVPNLIGICLGGIFCYGFLILALDNLELKKRIIATHRIVFISSLFVGIYLYGACMEYGLKYTDLLRTVSIISYCSLFSIIYLNRKKIKEILVN